ncbi:MAG TPA: AEC family transporter [Leptolyngbyaceae cyanobacterium]
MLFAKLLPMLLLCLIGYGLKRSKILEPEDTRTIGKLLTTLAIPAIVIKALATTPLDPNLLYLPLSALVVVAALALIASFCARAWGWDRATAGAFITAFPTLEGGAVGIPLMLLAFGDLGVSRFLLFDLTQGILLFTVIYAVSTWFGKEGIPVKAVILKLLRTPLVWAIFIGFIFNIFNLDSPAILDFLNLVGSSFLLLILILLGMELQLTLPALPLHLAITLLKAICGLGIGWLMATFFGLEGVERAAVIMGAAQPPSLVTILFAKENHLNAKLVTGFVSVAIPFSWVFLTAVLHTLQ